MADETATRKRWSRLVGGGLFASVFAWWAGLQAWATAQYGYLDLDVIGASPAIWVVLTALGGLALLSGLLPHRSLPLNLSAALVFAFPAVALATVNVAYGVEDGISMSGWFLALLSAAQVAMFLGALYSQQ